MTTLGAVVATAFILVFVFWVMALVRRDRLYAGYGMMFTCGGAGAVIVLAVPSLRRGLAAVSETLLPVPSLIFVPIVLLSFLIVYLFTQISVLANRVTKLTQQLAIRDAQRLHRGDSSALDRNGTIAAAPGSRREPFETSIG